MAEIVLTTLNAKYIHASFGLRYLFANLGELQSRACLAEFDINQRPTDIAEALLARKPKIIGFGVYIWNVAPTTEVVAAIKAVRPEVTIILGGPEVSYQEMPITHSQIPNTKSQIPKKSQEANSKGEGPVPELQIIGLADYVITGEADLKFAEICRELLGGAGQSSADFQSAVSQGFQPAGLGQAWARAKRQGVADWKARQSRLETCATIAGRLSFLKIEIDFANLRRLATWTRNEN